MKNNWNLIKFLSANEIIQIINEKLDNKNEEFKRKLE